MLVLGLLGMILYGAYTVVQQGKSAAKLDDAPAFATSDSPSAPVMDLPAMASAAPAAEQRDPTASDPGPTYLNAISAPPPAVGDVPSQATAVVPPPLPPATMPAMAIAPTAIAAADASAPAIPPVTVAGSAFDSAAIAMANAGPSASASRAADLDAGSLAVPNVQSSAFASAWADAHDKLANGRYAEALAVLSAWHDDPTLGLEESQRLEELLGQLAGTVIYSQEDLLLPPYIVAPGDTLPSIAMTVGVPWQLLAKINGVDAPDSLLPGEALKMVRGPFDAVVSVSRRRLSLQLGGNYAGSFPVVIGRRLQERVGVSLAVAEIRRERPAQPAGVAAQVSYLQSGDSAGPTILLSDGLRIEAAEDPLAISDQAPETSLVVAARDLDELLDILGPGSSVLIRQ